MQKNRQKGGFSRKGGPSDRIRTCGILLPKQARYQLRYTRLWSCFIRLGVFSQMWRGTSSATPGYSILSYYTTLQVKIKDFPVCGHSCGQGRFSARFCKPVKSRKRPCCKAFRASTFLVVDGVHSTPKPPALPTALVLNSFLYYNRRNCSCPVLPVGFP